MKMGKLREIIESEVFTTPEAADYLGMSRQNLSQQTKAGRIPCIRGKLYLRADLDEYNATARGGPERKGGDKKRGGREDPPLPSPTV
mgnify:FL=1